MKKIMVAAALTATLSAGAQTMTDAVRLTSSTYYGTARSIGLGNALTAVGGDLGSIEINPAGGAVAGYSQFAVSPNISIAVGTAAYAPSYEKTPKYEGAYRTNYTRFMMPNLGINFVFHTDNPSGLRSFNFGIVSNSTSNYNDSNTASGRDANTSITGSRAFWSCINSDGNWNMLDPKCLSDLSSAYAHNYWNYVAAYSSGMTNYSKANGCYFGSAEVEDPNVPARYGVPGELRQSFSTQTYGSRNDLAFNFGFNIDNCFYFGFNLVIPMARYTYSEFFKETPTNSSDFVIRPSFYDGKSGQYVQGNETRYTGSNYSYSYSSKASGFYAKFGLIWLPTESLRIGAAIQTPVSYSITQNYIVKSEAFFLDSSQSNDAYCKSDPESFKLRGPFEANFGVAYTFGDLGMVSVDYELKEHSMMRYSSNYYRSASLENVYSEVNTLNSFFCGLSHSLRAGAEINVAPFLAVRAGFNLLTSPERYYVTPDGVTVTGANYFANGYNEKYPSKSWLGRPITDSSKSVWSVSAGLGYRSRGSFFADLAVRRTSYPDNVYSLYSDYIFDNDNNVILHTPEELVTRKLWDVVLTLGWKF